LTTVLLIAIAYVGSRYLGFRGRTVELILVVIAFHILIFAGSSCAKNARVLTLLNASPVSAEKGLCGAEDVQEEGYGVLVSFMVISCIGHMQLIRPLYFSILAIGTPLVWLLPLVLLGTTLL